jgi:DNA-binding transcriptional ArsR family regulator
MSASAADARLAADRIQLCSILAALSEPVRLEIICRLASVDRDRPCNELYDNVSKSTATYHFRVLREAGLIEQYDGRGQRMNRLRAGELADRFPGVLDSILSAALPTP